MENVTLHGLKSNACPICEVPARELGTNIKKYRARDYARYERDGYLNRLPGSKSDGAHVKFHGLGINLGKNVFHGLHRVSVPDLHIQDILHTVYLRLFKHMMDWIQGFSRNTGVCRLLTTFGRHYRRTQDFWWPKKPTARLPSSKGKR